MIAGGHRHLVVDRGAVGRQGRIHHRHGGGRGRARRKNRKPAAQALPTIHAPTEGARTEGLGIVVAAVIDAAKRGLGTRGDGRQWWVGDKDKDLRGGGR